MNIRRRLFYVISVAFFLSGLLMNPQEVRAEPYLAIQQGLKCVACHVNPTGGGLRNDFGVVFARQIMPARPAAADARLWDGKVGDLLRVGGNLRTNWSAQSTPNQESQRKFELNQLRAYLDVALIPERLGLYVDQKVAPNDSLTREAYVRYGDTAGGWYVKGGRFYLPFGWRLQDNTAFTRLATRISMTTPDTGIELGYESEHLSAQLAASNGVINELEESGHQATAQLVWVRSAWRLGGAASFTESDVEDRRMGGVFAGLRTGPLSWLGEIDLIRDEDSTGVTRTSEAALAEVNWTIGTGHNLKLTAEYFEPNDDLGEDEQNRWSVVYELTPLPFVQLRVGHRRYDGVELIDAQNRKLTFVELHGFF